MVFPSEVFVLIRVGSSEEGDEVVGAEHEVRVLLHGIVRDVPLLVVKLAQIEMSAA